MSFDPIRNHAIVTVNTGYAIGATTIVLATGHGALLPDPATEGAFNLVWYNSTDYKNPSLDPLKEIIRVTARTGDTLTVVQPAVGNDYNGEGSDNVAHAHNITGRQYKMILAPTRKYMEDIQDELSSRPYGVSVGFADATYIVDGTDDDVQIQQAIDAVHAAGGGTVDVLEGTFDINTAPVTLKTGVYLRGRGFSTILKRDSGGALTYPVASDQSANISDFGISDMVIDADEASIIDGRYNLLIGNVTYTTTRYFLKNLWIKNSGKSALLIRNTSYLFADSLKVDTAVQLITADGWNLISTDNAYITNIDFNCGDDGLVMRSCRYVVVNNITRQNAPAGSAVRVTGDGTVPCSNIAVSNVVDTNGHNCFSITTFTEPTNSLYNIAATNLLAIGNNRGVVEISSTLTGLQDGITFPVNDVVISNFVARNCANGIFASNSGSFLMKNVRFSNGVIDGCTNHGIVFNSGKDVIFENIEVSNGAARGINMTQTAVTGKVFMSGVRFKNVNSHHNVEYGVAINIGGTDPEKFQSDFTFEGCNFDYNQIYGMIITNVQVFLRNVRASNNTTHGIQITNTGTTLMSWLENIRAESNGGYGINLANTGNLVNIIRPYLLNNVSGTTFDTKFHNTPNTLIDDITTGMFVIDHLRSFVDDGTFTIPTATSGFGEVIIGDNEEYAQFRWSKDGTVKLVVSTNLVIASNTDNFFCIFDNGSGIQLKNRLGSTKNGRIRLTFSPVSEASGSVNDHYLLPGTREFTGTITVPTPVAATDAANKAYVDAVAQGLSVKGSAKLATTAALPTNTYANGASGVGATLTATANSALTVDSVVVAVNDRILVKDEASGLKNGIYVVTAIGDASNPYVLTRSTDFDLAAEIPGGFVFIEAGTVNVAAGFVCTNSAAPTIGTTALTFTQFSGAGEIVAGNGISKSANTLSIDTSITVDKTTAQTLTNKTLTSPAITTPTGIVKGDVGLGNVDNTSDATKNAATATLTNKRVTARVSTTASSTTPTPNADTDDLFTITALVAGATFGAPTGTPTEGQDLTIRIKDNGGAQTLAYNAIYRAIGVVLPTTTVAGKTHYLRLKYNFTDTKWDVLAVGQEA